MYRNFYPILFLIFLSQQIFAQKINWVESFGGKSFDIGRNIILDPAGNSIILGGFSDTCYFNQTNFQVSNGGYDIFISKQNLSGNIIWSYGFGDQAYNKAESITCDANGDIYVVGNFTGTIDFNPGIGLDTLSAWIQSTGYVLKISSTGNFVWVKRIGGFLSNNSIPIGAITETNMIKYDHNGCLILGGRFEGALDFDFSPNKDSIIQGMGNYILKIDTNGNFNWVRIIKDIDVNELFTSIQTDKFGNIFSAGMFQGSKDFDLGPDVYLLTTSNFSLETYVLKLNSRGEFIWVKNIKGKGQLSINDIHVELENKIILCGNYSDSVGFDPGSNIKNHYTSNQSNGFLCYWTDSGTFLQSYSINSNRNNFAQTIHSDLAGNVFLSGFSLGKFWVTSNIQTDTFFPKQNNDILLLKFDPNGQIQWGKLLPGNGNMNQSNYIHNTAFNKNLNQLYYTGFFTDSTNFVLQKSGTQQSKGFIDIFLCNLQLCNSNLSFEQNAETFRINDTAYFSCTDALFGSSYQWQQNIAGEFVDVIDDSVYSGSGTSTLSIKKLNLNDNGKTFRCLVWADSCLTIGKHFHLSVEQCPKLIQTVVYNSTTNIDEPLSLILKTKESEKNEYEWQIFKLGKFERIPDSIAISGINNDTLIINQSKLFNDRNFFRCIINQEECLEKSDSILHTTNCSKLIGQTDSIKYYKIGDTVLLTVQSKIAEQYSWEMRILGSFIAISELSTRFKGMKNDTLLILNADANFDNTEFRCLLINGPCQAYPGVTTTKLNIDNLLPDLNKENQFEIYPNPAKETIFIKSETSYINKAYTLIDTKGKIIKSGTISSESNIELNGISRGMYLILLNDLSMKPMKFIID